MILFEPRRTMSRSAETKQVSTARIFAIPSAGDPLSTRISLKRTIQRPRVEANFVADMLKHLAASL